jgi:hypothetical protein
MALLMPGRMAAAPAPATYAITNVTVVPMDRERLIPGQTVIVRGGRITAIGPAARTKVPAGAAVIPGRGRFLMPGLAEMHAHVPPGTDQQWIDDVLFLYSANGVTFARSMLGVPHHLDLRAKVERGEVLAPRIYTSGPSLNGNSVATPADGRRIVAEQKKAGYDFLKIHPGLDRPRYDAIAETARALGMPLGGHVPDAVGLVRALAVSQATVDHLDGYMSLLVRDGSPLANAAQGFFGFDLTSEVDERKIPEVVRLTKAAGTWNVPTQSLLEHVLLPEPTGAQLIQREEMRYVPKKMREQWLKAKGDRLADPSYDPAKARRFIEVRRKLIKGLHDGGAGLLLGSDAPQWFNVPGVRAASRTAHAGRIRPDAITRRCPPHAQTWRSSLIRKRISAPSLRASAPTSSCWKRTRSRTSAMCRSAPRDAQWPLAPGKPDPCRARRNRQTQRQLGDAGEGRRCSKRAARLAAVSETARLDAQLLMAHALGTRPGACASFRRWRNPCPRLSRPWSSAAWHMSRSPT